MRYARIQVLVFWARLQVLVLWARLLLRATLLPETFVNCNTTVHAPCVSTLCVTGSRERLPQVGFNTMDGRQLPFPEDLPINRETLPHFAAAFFSGRLQSSSDAKKAMIVSRPFSTHNTVRRKNKRVAPIEVRGVSEQLKPKDAIMQASQ